MCYGDQATLPINKGYNTHKKGEAIFKKREPNTKNPKDKKTLNPYL